MVTIYMQTLSHWTDINRSMTNIGIKIKITLNPYGINPYVARISVCSLIYYELITDHKTATLAYEVGEDWLKVYSCDDNPIGILGYAKNFKIAW